MTQEEMAALFQQSPTAQPVGAPPQEENLTALFEQSAPAGEIEEHQESLQEIMAGVRGELPEPKSYEDIEYYGLVPSEVPERTFGDVLMGTGANPVDIQNRIYEVLMERATDDRPLEEASDIILDITPAGKAAGAVGALAAGAAAYKGAQFLKRTRYKGMELGKLSAIASKGDKPAMAELATRAQADKGAMDAADRLGIDLPADVWATGEKGIELQKTAGLARSQIGQEEAVFAQTIRNAAQTADSIKSQLGATSDIATVSDDVLNKLQTNREELRATSKKIYESVSGQMPRKISMELPNVRGTVEETIRELGGDVTKLSKEEKKLLTMLGVGDVNYATLERERRAIGKALGKMKSGPYKDSDEYLLGKVYGAIKQDQLHNVEKRLGGAVAEDLRTADRLTSKRKALEDSIIKTFGKETTGSIAELMNRAITLGAKGNISAMNKLLDAVPKDMHGEVMATALSNMVKGTENIPFDFAKYTKVYKGLLDNPPVYKKFINAVGKDKHQLLNDLYQTSKAITDARGNLIKTGRSMQPVLESMQAEGIVTKLIRFGLEKVPGKLGVPVKLDALLMTPKDRVEAVSKMFRSPAFKDMIREAAVKTDGPSNKAIDAFLKEPAVNKMAMEAAAKTGQTAKEVIHEVIRTPYPKVPEEFRIEKIKPDEPGFRMEPKYPPATMVRETPEAIAKTEQQIRVDRAMAEGQQRKARSEQQRKVQEAAEPMIGGSEEEAAQARERLFKPGADAGLKGMTDEAIQEIESMREAEDLFSQGRGTAGGALGGAALGASEGLYQDMVQNKDMTVGDYLARIAGGAAVGAAVGRYARPEGIGAFAGAAPKQIKAMKETTRDTNFKNWFTGSKVVGDGGEPLVVYHGTKGDFGTFALEKGGTASRASDAKHGFFFTPNKDIAGEYADFANNPHWAKYEKALDDWKAEKISYDEFKKIEDAFSKLPMEETQRTGAMGQSVMPVYLDIKNPKIIDHIKLYNKDAFDFEIKYAKEQGHDGVIFKNIEDRISGGEWKGASDTYVTFKPSQIKSVNNKGAFSKDGNILKGALIVPAAGAGVAATQEKETE